MVVVIRSVVVAVMVDSLCVGSFEGTFEELLKLVMEVLAPDGK